MSVRITDLHANSGVTKLTRNEVAAVRGWLHGLPVADLASRYLYDPAEDDDAPTTSQALARLHRLRDALIQLAHHNNEIDLAIALRAGPAGPEKGIRAAVAMLPKLERMGGAAKPQPDHVVELWFSSMLAKRLRRAGITTLRDLIERANAHGAGWWRGLPRIGAVTADVITRWVLKHTDSLGTIDDVTLRPAATLFAPPEELAPTVIDIGARMVVPLELIRVRAPALSGVTGSNRAPVIRNRLSADNDFEAVKTWLSLFQSSQNTFTAYRKEAERLVLWAVVERGMAMSDMRVEDAIAYRDFLAAPTPEWRWIGPAAAGRWSSRWRPFNRPLGYTSVKYAITVLKSMFDWLTKQRYLDSNPFDALPRMPARGPRMQIQKALTKSAWDTTLEWVKGRCSGDDQEAAMGRIALCAVLILRDSGLRISEACSVTRASLRHMSGKDAGWEMDVLGKGNRLRTVPVSDRAIDALRAHWRDRGLDFDGIMNDEPLIAPLARPQTQRSKTKDQTGMRQYSTSGLRRIVAQVFTRLAKEVGTVDGADISGKRPHALRHTMAVHALEAGAELDVIQQVLGHASLNTTTVYVVGDTARRRRQMRQVFSA